MSSAPLRIALVGLNSPGYQSLALGYVRAYAQADLRLSGRVAFLTLDLEVTVDPWWVAYRVLRSEPDVVGFSVTCWNARSVYEACRIVKSARPDTFVVLGGPEVTAIAEEVVATNPAVDAVVRGEGEEIFAELLYAITRRRDVWRVEGVTARNHTGDVVSAPDRPLIADLDSIPSPYLAGVLAPRDGSAYLETYRGCPHRCGYCFEGKGYGRIRSFSHERVESEIAAVAGTPDVRSFSFIDPVFNLTDERLSWLSEVLAPWAARGTVLHTVEVDIERVDEGAARLLRSAGVASVETGPQSVGATALENCRRGFDAERFVAGVVALKAVGIAVECDLIVGLPGDRLADVLEGLSFIVSADPGKLQASTLHVLPGTDLWQRADEFGLTFDHQPPHELIQTASMSFADLRRAEVLATALGSEYGARI